jgi:hypothetical protein
MAWGKSMAWGGGTFKKTQSVVRHHTLSEQTESLNGAKQWRGIMGGQTLEIMLASAMVIIPMLALSVVLIVLVHNHLVPDNSSTYSTGNSTGIPLGSAYYIDYSATRLVFISSLSSTLATLLISAAMCLFSYPVAYGSKAQTVGIGAGSDQSSSYASISGPSRVRTRRRHGTSKGHCLK